MTMPGSSDIGNPTVDLISVPAMSWLGIVRGSYIQGLFEEKTHPGPIAGNCSESDIVLVKTNSDAEVEINLIANGASALHRVLLELGNTGMNPEHPPEVISEARNFLTIDPTNDSLLGDLTDLPFVTIDNDDSRDLDQALYIEATDNGTFVVHYALADASWFVKPGSALFIEALKRGVTYYAPDFNVPMLPRLLSENLISLNEKTVRRALVFHMKLNALGEVMSTDISRSKINSVAKLSYSSVQSFYDSYNTDTHHNYTDKPFANSLIQLSAVGELRMKKALERDVVELNRRETQVSISDNNQRPFEITVRKRFKSEQYNEQISLLCNMEGARLLNKMGRSTDDLQSVFKVHLPPLSSRMARLQQQVTALVHARDLPEIWLWDSNTSIADYIAALPDSVKHSRVRQCIERMVMMTNRASTFESEPGGHSALRVSAYARFSSPMREFVGIFTHKEICEALDFDPPDDADEDRELRAQVIEQANIAKSRQNQLEKSFQLMAIKDYLEADLQLSAEHRPWRKATVIGIQNNRLYLNLDGFALDIKLYTQDLTAQYGCEYTCGIVTATPQNVACPSFTIGDAVTIRTDKWQAQSQKFSFNIEPAEAFPH